MSTSYDELPERSRVVADALRAAGADAQVRQLDASARTAADAAEALGCEVGAIANSLVFMADSVPLLVLASGAARVDTQLIARTLGKESIVRATPDQVRAATGQAIGGVAPLGHPARLETVIDTELREYPQLWAAAGTPHTVFRTDFTQLRALTGASAIQVR